MWHEKTGSFTKNISEKNNKQNICYTYLLVTKMLFMDMLIEYSERERLQLNQLAFPPVLDKKRAHSKAVKKIDLKRNDYSVS